MPGAVPVLQVGDLEWHPDRPPLAAPWPIYFCEGNHDHLPSLLGLREPTEVARNWIYCPRGSVITLGDKRIGFLGGARSIDRAVRTEGRSWWPEEEPTHEEAARLADHEIDLLVTHTPPASVMRVMGYNRAPDERASIVVERAWAELGYPSLVCGHMHQRFTYANVLVLGYLDAWVTSDSRRQ